MTGINTKKKAQLIAEACLDKKAEGIVLLEMKKIFPICDYFLIASGASTRQVKAIAENIRERLSRHHIKHWHIEGHEAGQWVLLDYGDVVVHIFLTELRDFYNLERLWGDAPKTTFSPHSAVS